MKTKNIFRQVTILLAYLLLITQSIYAVDEIDTELDVGSIDGAHAVNLTGAFTYTIPIKIPEGTMGMQPNLSLNYNSQGGNGIAGYGWNLSGMSAISRVNKTIYHDGAVSAPDLSDNDALALDGTRILYKGINKIDGIERHIYNPEMRTFQRIYTINKNNLNGFIVKTKDGKTIEYGHTADSKLMAEDGITILAWYINKVTDRNGNYMTYHYANYGRQVFLNKIEYTGNDKLDPNDPTKTILAPYAEVKFSYKEGIVLPRFQTTNFDF